MGAVEQLVKRRARELGFDLVGIASADPFPADEEVAVERIREGRMDGLPWFTEQRVQQGTRPEQLLPGARSLLAVGASYHAGPPDPPSEGLRGTVARYAWGRDYHRALKKRLKALVRTLEEDLQRPIRARVFVDDGPMLDRAVAQRAGIGWFGKNTNILTPSHGSWVVLGQVLWDLELEPDAPLKKTCGECRRCIDACPTGAIVAPYVVDNSKCISYFTIECRGPIPREFRPLIGNWVFGCDLCQDVCPVNRKAQSARIPELRERRAGPALELLPLLELTEEEFQGRFRGTAIMRAKLEGLQRNACVALGNLGDPVAVPALARALRQGVSLVRGHAAWALGRLGGPQAAQVLGEALAHEADPWVREEIAQGPAERLAGT
jgi:epoxyqueuosine reductase